MLSKMKSILALSGVLILAPGLVLAVDSAHNSKSIKTAKSIEEHCQAQCKGNKEKSCLGKCEIKAQNAAKDSKTDAKPHTNT